jgi:hypothetical protein
MGWSAATRKFGELVSFQLSQKKKSKLFSNLPLGEEINIY